MPRSTSLSLTLGALFLWAATHAAAADFSLTPTGGNTFQIVASGLQQVGGVDVIVTYDPASYGSPQVTQAPLASGSFFAANPNIPGQIRIALVHATGISGSGPLATITFGVVRSSNTPPTLRVNSVIDTNARSLIADSGSPSPPASTGSPSPSGGVGVGTTPGKPFSDGPEPTEPIPSGRGAAPTTPHQTTIATFPGTITLPPGMTDEPRTDTPPPPPVVEPPESPEPRRDFHAPPPADDRKEAPAPKRTLPTPPPSVLQQFADWKGDRSVATLAPLFDPPGDSWVTQTPAIAVADGTAPVTVRIDPGWKGENPPSFGLKGASLKSLSTSGVTGWTLELLPSAGVTSVTLSMELDDATAEIPLVVIPPLPPEWRGKPLTDGAVNRFLAERGDGKKPVGDLNGDGKRDYRDDYIMVGHLLHSRPVPEKEGKVRKEEGAGKGEQPPRSPAAGSR